MWPNNVHAFTFLLKMKASLGFSLPKTHPFKAAGLGFNNDFMNQRLLSHEIDMTWRGVLRGLVEVASWVIWRLEGSLSAIILGERTCPLCHVIPRSQLRCVLYDLSSTVFIPATQHTTSLLKSLINVKLHVMCFPPLSSLCVL